MLNATTYGIIIKVRVSFDGVEPCPQYKLTPSGLRVTTTLEYEW